MRFSMILEMVDRLSAPARRARAGVGGLADQARAMGQRIRRAAGDVASGERSLSGFARSARRAATVGLGRMFQSAGQRARGLSRDLGALVTRLRLVERAGFATGRGLRKLGGMAAGLLKSGIFAGGAAVAGAGGFALFDLFRTAGQFEQFQASLEGTEGSVNAARQSMAWVQKFAAETPYELADVMQGFVALRQFGIDPMDGSLKALGDASAAIGAPLDQAVQMLTDATTGEFERLKEFGIKARKEGSRTVFSFVKDGKDIERSVTGTGAVIQQALLGIFNERFGGGMVRQSKTLFGIVANLKDKWSGFLLMVANAGIFDFVKGKLQVLLDKVDQMAANGELQEWAQAISDKMIKAWEWGEKFIEHDWKSVEQEFQNIADAISAAADAILLLKDAFAWLNTGSAADDFVYSLPERIKGVFKEPSLPEPGVIPIGAEMLRSGGVRLPNFGRQSSVDVGGKIKVDVTSSQDLKVRATPVKANPKVPLEVNTGRAMRWGS